MGTIILCIIAGWMVYDINKDRRAMKELREATKLTPEQEIKGHERALAYIDGEIAWLETSRNYYSPNDRAVFYSSFSEGSELETRETEGELQEDGTYLHINPFPLDGYELEELKFLNERKDRLMARIEELEAIKTK